MGHIEVVKFLISHGANIETKTIFKLTPLMAASLYGHIEIVKILIANGANIEYESIQKLRYFLHHKEII